MKLLVVFGTRPEAIKMAPLIRELQKHKESLDVKVCVTAQHREMLDQVLAFFEIVPDFDLDLMKPGQDLFSLTSCILKEMKSVFYESNPDYVVVHGDTTTSFAVSLAAFYSGISIAHVEAGLRTYNKFSPFPEEMNRVLTSKLTDVHFCPTEKSKLNLINEGVDSKSIFLTGNTVIDAFRESLKRVSSDSFVCPEIENLRRTLFIDDLPVILVTGHRRENFGDGLRNVFKAIVDIVQKSRVKVVYPVHLNPMVSGPAKDLLGNRKNIHLISPLSYPAFVWLMSKSKLIITDSGGVQEEAPSLGIPTLITRETTERPEAIIAGTSILVGTDSSLIEKEALSLLYDEDRYERIRKVSNPFGDGSASIQITNFFLEKNRIELE